MADLFSVSGGAGAGAGAGADMAGGEFVPNLMGGVKASQVERRVRESTGLSDNYELRVLRPGAEPRGRRHVKLPLKPHQQAFLNCVATLGVGYVDATGDNFIFDKDFCSGVHFADKTPNRELASRYIYMLNEMLPKLNAAMVWARRNWIFEHLMIPVIKASEVKDSKLWDTSANKVPDEQNFEITNVKFSAGSSGNTESVYALITADGYVDLTLANSLQIYWVDLHPRKEKSRHIHVDCRVAMRKKIGEGTANPKPPSAFDSAAYWQMLRTKNTNGPAAAELPIGKWDGSTDVEVDDGSGTPQAKIPKVDGNKDEYIAMGNMLANLDVYFQKGDQTKYVDEYKKFMEKLDDMYGPITNEGYGLYARVFSDHYGQYQEKNKRELYDSSIRTLTRTAVIADPFRIEFRDVDLRVPVVTGMEVVYVRQALDESDYAVFPTKLFAWSDKLETFSNNVQQYVNLHGNKSFMEKMTQLLSSDREILKQFREASLTEGGYLGNADNSIDALATLALQHIEQCGLIPFKHPDIRSQTDLESKKHEKTTVKLSQLEMQKYKDAAGNEQTIKDGKIKAADACNIETKADGTVVGMARPFHELFFAEKVSGSGKIGAEYVSEEVKDLYRDLSTEMAKKAQKEQANRESLFGASSGSRSRR